MKTQLGALAILVLLAGCSGQGKDVKGVDGKTQAGIPSVTTTDADPALAAYSGDQKRSIGSAPDTGELFAFEKGVKHEGAYTLRPIRVSEEHAIRGVASGMMTVPGPDGTPIKIRYEGHEEDASGNWSWIGRVVGGDDAQEAIITFGEKAVFGYIPQANGTALRLTTAANGVAYLVQADASRLFKSHRVGSDTRTRVAQASQLDAYAANLVTMATAKAREKAAADTTKALANPPVIDLEVGYSSNYVAYRGSASAALTRISNMVAAANQALKNSQINASIRVVGTLQVDYPDNTDNGDALDQLTGSDGTNTFTPPAALLPLRTARDTNGADLVTLVRRLVPENNGCGIAWLLGADQTPIVTASDAPYAYSVVSDGDYDLNGNTYFCDDITLAHELAHNMGSAHDVANAGGVSGRFPYSYGYKTSAAAGNFFTVMAYGDNNQTLYRIFSSPALTICGGFACGVANQADNARSLRQTVLNVVQFRATKIPVVLKTSDLYAVNKQGTTNTEVHALSASSTFKNFTKHLSTTFAKAGTSVAWTFLFGDYNGDGVVDMYGIYKIPTAGKTEVHVMNGVGNYKTSLFSGPTALGNTGSDARWVYQLADYNLDGKLDLYAINRMGTTMTEVHILDGATNYQTFLLQTSTALGKTGTNNSWKFDLADANSDGVPDLFAINKAAGATATEVFVLSGAGGFKTFLSSTSTILGKTGTDNLWDFKVSDYNNDGKIDVYAIKKQTPGGKTEVHVLNGATNYQSYLVNVATGLGVTGDNNAWEFALVN